MIPSVIQIPKFTSRSGRDMNANFGKITLARSMRTLGRVLFGLILACLAAGLSHMLFATYGLAHAATQAAPLELVLLTATHYFLFSAPFAIIAASLAEWLSIRHLAYYLLAALAIAFAGFTAQYANEGADFTILNDYAIRAFLTAGFFGGFVYWLVAGQTAGRAPGGATPPP